jgi:hypothetical protein
VLEDTAMCYHMNHNKSSMQGGMFLVSSLCSSHSKRECVVTGTSSIDTAI